MKMTDMVCEQKVDSEAETIATKVLEEIKYSPELASEIGSLLIAYAEQDVAQALVDALEVMK